MSKPKQSDHKKILVRNTSRTLSKTSISTSKSKCLSRDKSTKSDKKSTSTTLQAEDIDDKFVQTFETPELNTTLKLAKKIDCVEYLKPRKTKSSSAVETTKLTYDDKVTKLVNFPYEQHLYRDLIPINVKEEVSPPVSSRAPLPHRDKEPVLSDFCKPRKAKEYHYQPKIKLETEKLGPVKLNNLRLYKILQLAHDS